ncbi:MAG: HlyD family efflux transporter periplasmic adaptor subunit [Clostridiales bacterium]|jgi:HlyD family secretion protein|nr:HlyD family efflux transporter periplasmic adaptor subunit [Clostridiales bacterium]
MKKNVKIILAVAAAIGAVAAAFYYISMPLAVDTIVTEKAPAEMYFIEKGEAAPSEEVDVYTMVAGKIDSIHVEEEDYIEEGDVICILDTTDLELQIDELEASIDSYEAQIDNLDQQEEKEKDALSTNKSNLQAQLNSIDALKNSTDSTKGSQVELQTSINSQYEESLAYAQEKLKNSNDNIAYAEESLTYTQNNLTYAENDLANAENDHNNATILFENGVISQNDFDNSLRSVEAARKALDAAKKSVADAEKALEDSKKAVIDYEKQVEDSQALIEQGSKQLSIIESGDPTSTSEYYDSQREQVSVQIEGIDEQLSKSYTGSMQDYYAALIDSCQVNIESVEDMIEDYTILAPVSGKIEGSYMKGSSFVNSQSPLVKILETRKNEIEVFVTTNNIEEIEIGQETELILKRRDGDITLTGVISKIDDKATTKISSLGIEEKRVKVTITPDDNDALKAGYDVDVKFIYYQEPNAITVPKTAVFSVDGKDMVWAIRDGVLVMAPIKKGMELRTDYVVEGGLSENEYVVKDANEKELTEGRKAAGPEQTP